MAVCWCVSLELCHVSVKKSVDTIIIIIRFSYWFLTHMEPHNIWNNRRIRRSIGMNVEDRGEDLMVFIWMNCTHEISGKSHERHMWIITQFQCGVSKKHRYIQYFMFYTFSHACVFIFTIHFFSCFFLHTINVLSHDSDVHLWFIIFFTYNSFVFTFDIFTRFIYVRMIITWFIHFSHVIFKSPRFKRCDWLTFITEEKEHGQTLTKAN